MSIKFPKTNIVFFSTQREQSFNIADCSTEIVVTEYCEGPPRAQ